MKIFNSLASLDQIRGSPLSPMLREIVVRMLGNFEYSPEDDGFVVLVELGDVDRVLTDLDSYLRNWIRDHKNHLTDVL